ncbi:hypothetical protein H0N98_02055 [Candidatus Micrarchaeota archaeon]|nr:hypothetical protein [Candidatus Micrarchaeota archaeon]
MRNCIRISIFLLFVALLLSENASAKTVYLNNTGSPITYDRFTASCFGPDYVNLCNPYPISFYYVLSPTTFLSSIPTYPIYDNTYCTFPVYWAGCNQSCCHSNYPSLTAIYGRGWEGNETGTVPAGTWTFGVTTQSTTSTGVGTVLVYVWNVCSINFGPNGYETDTLLFTVNGSKDHITAGTNTEVITTNQPSFIFTGGKQTEFCYLIVEYHLNVSTGSGSGSDTVSLISGGANPSYISYPTPINAINSVALNSPQTDPSLNATQTFLMNCTPNTDDSLYGINMSFEYSYFGNSTFTAIPMSGSMLVANATTALVNVRNNTMYSILVNASTGNDYYVRCRLYNSTTNITSNAQLVSVRYPPKLTIAEFRLYAQSGFSLTFGTGTNVCDIKSAYGSSLSNLNCSDGGFYESNQYRAELEVCNDQLFGRDVSITGIAHGNLTAAYMGDLLYMVCGSGTSDTGVGNWDMINCDWNQTNQSALYMDTTAYYFYGGTIPPLVGSKVSNTRTGYSCRWYVYTFMTYPVLNDTWVMSNATTFGASLGSNPQVARMPILFHTIAHPQIAEFRIYQSSNMTTLGSGTQVCDISSSYGSNILDNSTCTGLTSVTQYRAEVRLCYDWPLEGKNINITGLVHGNLTSNYIGTWGGCATGSNTLTSISCNWNNTVLNGVYINTSTSPQFTTGSRSATSCQWFVYNFATNSLTNNTVAISNVSTQGVSSGINPQVSNLTISITPQSFMSGVTLNSPSTDLNVTDLSNFSMICTPSTGGGYGINLTFEYNTTSQGWGTIPSAGANLTIDGNNPNVNVSNGIPYLNWYVHTVNVSLNSFGTYWIRCRINNATTSLYSNAVKIGVYRGLLNITLQNPSPLVYNSSNPLVIGQYSPFIVNASVNCSSIGSLGGCGGVSCSVRYNSSSALADTLVNETQGATPFYVISSNMTHDFTGVSNPSSNHQAMYGICSFGSLTYKPPTDITAVPSSERPTSDYIALSSEDGVEARWVFRSFDVAVFQQFRFQLNESIGSINNIRVYYKGSSSGATTTTTACDTVSYLTRFFVWNFTAGSWQLMGNHSLPYDSVISVNFTSGFTGVINSSYMYVLASSDLGRNGCGENISTDFVKIDVNLKNNSVVPCGNLSANQICKFSWLLNATGVNELRVIDVNCSSAKTTVASNHSNDSYIFLKGVEIHTDKGTYRNCGKVFYKVSSYNSDGNAFDQNFTVNIYDTVGNLMNQSRVQTSGGSYSGNYILQAGAPVGQWLIKAFSCGVFNKTFGVGIGNSSAFWRAEWQMQNRVKYSPGDNIKVIIKFYNQAGEGQGSFTATRYLDTTFWGGCNSITKGQVDCSVIAPSSNGTHSINVYANMGGGVIFNETRYFYVGG